MKKEVVKKVIAKLKKESFNKENPTELMSQLIKVVSRDYHDIDAENVIKELKEVSSHLFKLKKGR